MIDVVNNYLLFAQAHTLYIIRYRPELFLEGLFRKVHSLHVLLNHYLVSYPYSGFFYVTSAQVYVAVVVIVRYKLILLFLWIRISSK